MGLGKIHGFGVSEWEDLIGQHDTMLMLMLDALFFFVGHSVASVGFVGLTLHTGIIQWTREYCTFSSLCGDGAALLPVMSLQLTSAARPKRGRPQHRTGNRWRDDVVHFHVANIKRDPINGCSSAMMVDIVINGAATQFNQWR